MRSLVGIILEHNTTSRLKLNSAEMVTLVLEIRRLGSKTVILLIKRLLQRTKNHVLTAASANANTVNMITAGIQSKTP